MKTLIGMVLAALAFTALPVSAADDAAAAVAMVDTGLAYLQKNGKDALIEEVNKKILNSSRKACISPCEHSTVPS